MASAPHSSHTATWSGWGWAAGLPLQQFLSFPRVGAGSPAKATLLLLAQTETKQSSQGLGEGGEAPIPLPSIPAFLLSFCGQTRRGISASHPAAGSIPKAAWINPRGMYLWVSLSMNRLVKSFTWVTRSPKGFTLRATLSEVSRTKNRSTGQSGKKRRGRNWLAVLLHRLPIPGFPHCPPGFPPSRLLGSGLRGMLSHPNPLGIKSKQAHFFRRRNFVAFNTFLYFLPRFHSKDYLCKTYTTYYTK